MNSFNIFSSSRTQLPQGASFSLTKRCCPSYRHVRSAERTISDPYADCSRSSTPCSSSGHEHASTESSVSADTVAALEDLGFSTEAATKLLRKNPALDAPLTDSASVLREFIDAESLPSVINRNPCLLHTSEGDLRNFFAYISSLGVRRYARLVSALVVPPPEERGHLSVTDWFQHYMEPKIEFLSSIGVNRVGRVIEFFPQFLQLDPAYMTHVVDVLRRIGVGRLQAVIERIPTLLGLSVEKNMRPRIAFLQHGLGLSKGEIAVMIEAYPPLLGYSLEKRIIPTSLILQHELGYPDMKSFRSFLIRYPRLLCVRVVVMRSRLRFMREVLNIDFMDDPLFPTKDLKGSWIKVTIARKHIAQWNIRTTLRRTKQVLLAKAGLEPADWAHYEAEFVSMFGDAAPAESDQDPPWLDEKVADMMGLVRRALAAGVDAADGSMITFANGCIVESDPGLSDLEDSFEEVEGPDAEGDSSEALLAGARLPPVRGMGRKRARPRASIDREKALALNLALKDAAPGSDVELGLESDSPP